MFAEITTALQILHWVVFDLEIKLAILTFTEVAEDTLLAVTGAVMKNGGSVV